jgi:predicted nucleic acid-binding protein
MILSDLGKSRVHPKLREWSESTDFSNAHISVISVEEIELGILLKARKDEVQAKYLRRWFNDLLDTFQGRIIPIDAEVAIKTASLHVERTRPANDARIAATALTHRLALVSRNVTHFTDLGLTLINPYD